jgi:hypothetical protein
MSARTWTRRDGIWLFFVGSLGCMFAPCGNGGPPPPDSCNASTAGDVTAIEIGGGSFGDAEPFAPVDDGGWVHTVTGGQGSPMLPLRLRITGASPPTCLMQSTTVSDRQGQRLTGLATALATYDDTGGRRATKTFFLIIPEETISGTIEVVAGGITRRIAFTASSYDAAVPADLAELPDLLDAGADASPAD